MKRITIIISILISFTFVYGQTGAPKDSLILGKQYRITGIDGSKVIGILLKIDSLNIQIRTPINILTISKHQTKSVRKISEDIYYSHELYDITLTSGERIKDCSISNIILDTVIIDKNSKELKINVDKIIRIINKHEDYMFISVIGGAATGALLGALVGSSLDNPNGLGPTSIGTVSGLSLGILVGGIAGFIVGSAISEDIIFDLSTKNTEQKIIVLKNIIQAQTENLN